MYTKKQKLEIYAIFLLICYSILIVTTFIAKKATLALYTSDQSPIWAFPFHWLLPIWILIYTLIGLSGAKVWVERKSDSRKRALYAWIAILGFNALWPVAYLFVPHPLLTLGLISSLFITVFFFLFNAFLVSKTAGYLMVPFAFMILYLLLLHWTILILSG